MYFSVDRQHKNKRQSVHYLSQLQSNFKLKVGTSFCSIHVEYLKLCHHCAFLCWICEST